MSASLLLKAKPVTEKIYTNLKSATVEFQNKTKHIPTLATVIVGEDPASKIYVQKKGEMCKTIGFGHKDFKLDATVSQSELSELIKKLNHDNSVDGILVQSPLPKPLDERKIFDLISPEKDVDCFSPHNVGLLSQGRGVLLPCTPAGVIELLKHYNISTESKSALVIGRSDIVGKPVAMLLTQLNATVTLAHSKTKNMKELVAAADIIVLAIGRANFLTNDFQFKKTCIVIDVGINRLDSGKVVGDANQEMITQCISGITPVPGGVGPMTIAMLMVNTFRASCLRKGLPITI